MKRAIEEKPSDAPELARQISEALQRERVIPRFVDSYVVENGRQALQVHAALYRDLLGLLQREALLAVSARALELACNEVRGEKKSKSQGMSRREAGLFRRKFLGALARQQAWTAGDALDFQSDLRMYEELLARAAPAGRSRKTIGATNHPFVDRCAFLLDSSFMEKARLAATKTLARLDELAWQAAEAQAQAQTKTRAR